MRTQERCDVLEAMDQCDGIEMLVGVFCMQDGR